MAVPDLLLDPSLRYWVLFPILFVMILVGMLRHYATVLLQPKPKLAPLKQLREQQFLVLANNLKVAYDVMPFGTFDGLRNTLAKEFRAGEYLQNPELKGKAPPNMLTDPKAMDGMMQMLKGNIAMIVPQTLMMSWINFFFAGFILLKLPFPLTVQFKSMLQSGIATPDLDVRWVSSISWYFLCLIGLQPLYNLILGDENKAGSVTNQQPMANPMQAGMDMSKMFEAEAENLDLVKHEYILDGIEKRMLEMYGVN